MSTIEREEYRLWKRPRDGIWYVVTGSGANTKSVSTRTTVLADAEIYRAQFIAGIDNTPPPPDVLVSELLDRYRNEHGVKTRTLSSIDFQIKFLKPHFGKLQPAQITNKSLEGYAKKRRTMGKRKGDKIVNEPVSNGTIIREIGTLKAALRFAAGNRWIPPMPPLQCPVEQPLPRDRWLSRDEARKLIAETKSEHVRLFIKLALATAARSGAILDLRWEQVDFDRRLINFGRGYGNKRRSIVPMNDETYEDLWLAHTIRKTDYVIEFEGKAVASVKTAFRRLAKRCGADASPHTLRHTAATWLVMDGVPLAEVARLLGDNEKTVEKVYGKHAPDYLRRAVNALKVGFDSRGYQNEASRIC